MLYLFSFNEDSSAPKIVYTEGDLFGGENSGVDLNDEGQIKFKGQKRRL